MDFEKILKIQPCNQNDNLNNQLHSSSESHDIVMHSTNFTDTYIFCVAAKGTKKSNEIYFSLNSSQCEFPLQYDNCNLLQ